MDTVDLMHCPRCKGIKDALEAGVGLCNDCLRQKSARAEAKRINEAAHDMTGRTMVYWCGMPVMGARSRDGKIQVHMKYSGKWVEAWNDSVSIVRY